MLRILLLLVVLMALSRSAWACDMSPAQRSTTVTGFAENGLVCLTSPPGDARFDPALEQDFFDAINRERAQRGLPQLQRRPQMQLAARFHSLDMGVNNFFEHEAPGGRTQYERLGAFDRTLLAQGSSENLAQFGPAVCRTEDQREVSCDLAPGLDAPEQGLVIDDLHQKLMDSEGHRANILDPDKTHVEIGVVRSGTGVYVTQVFAEVSGELAAPLPYRLAAKSPLAVSATLPGCGFSRFALEQDGEMQDLPDGTLPAGVTGPAALNVRAEITTTERDGMDVRTIVSWVYLSGPRLDVVPATGN